MKPALVVLLLVCSAVAYSQEAGMLITKIRERQASLRSLAYTLIRTDTLVTGHTRVIRGEAFINPGTLNENTPLEFLFKRLDAQSELLQSGGRLLYMDHAGRQYSVHNTILPEEIETKPAGQVFLPDMLALDTSNTLRMEVKDSAGFKVLILHRTDIDEYDVRNRYKVIVVDTTIYLPVSVRIHQETAGKVQDLFYDFNNISINKSETQRVIQNRIVPAGFTRMEILREPEKDIKGKPAPDFRLTDSSGKLVTLSNMRGKVVLLDFWEVWCGPCLASMPEIDKLFLKYRSSGLVVMGVLVRPEQWIQARQMKKVIQNHFQQLIGNKQIANDYEVFAIPYYVLIDRNGKVIFTSTGYSSELENAIKAAL